MARRSIKLSRRTYEALSEIADQEGCSVSEMGEQMISDGVQEYQEENEEDNGEDEEEPDDILCCPECDEETPEDADVCPSCGEEIEE